jgi:hypothetical protein
MLSQKEKNNDLKEQYDESIRKYSLASNGYYILRLDSSVNWDYLTNFIFIGLLKTDVLNYNKSDINVLIKSLILARIFEYSDIQIPEEVAKSKIFINFLQLNSEESIPTFSLINTFRQTLLENNLYDALLENFYNQLIEHNFELSHSFNYDSINHSDENTNENQIDEEYKFIDNDKIYAKMTDLYFKTLDDANIDESQKENGINSNHIMKKLQYVDEFIQDLKKKIDNRNEIEKQIEEPIELHPAFKKEGIFNDENLTEDYELGYRYHQLGLKMGFFNVKLDENNESSRISTAEFFPNTFWATVKQRSRWIAGICFQNWKAHKWEGNLTMKYFLFRDRKPLFSLLSAFLSNLILFYLIYVVTTKFFFDGKSAYIISNSMALWFLMAANVIFMISRASHRFIFTYNWYGFKYAFFSFFRLVIDTAINFFAVLRSISVYRRSKKKVVWDATTHY